LLTCGRIAIDLAMRRISLAITAVLAVSLPSQSIALSTVCSHPKRARTLSAATIALPTGDTRPLERRFDVIAKRIGMLPWGSALSDANGKIERQTIGLQSPKVSVSIEARWQSGQKYATLRVRRTCINDALEPWHGYWRTLLQELKRSGYKVSPAAIVQDQ